MPVVTIRFVQELGRVRIRDTALYLESSSRSPCPLHMPTSGGDVLCIRKVGSMMVSRSTTDSQVLVGCAFKHIFTSYAGASAGGCERIVNKRNTSYMFNILKICCFVSNINIVLLHFDPVSRRPEPPSIATAAYRSQLRQAFVRHIRSPIDVIHSNRNLWIRFCDINGIEEELIRFAISAPTIISRTINSALQLVAAWDGHLISMLTRKLL